MLDEQAAYGLLKASDKLRFLSSRFQVTVMSSTNGHVPYGFFYDEFNRELSLEQAKEEVRRHPKRGAVLYRLTPGGREMYDEWAFRNRLPGSTPRRPQLVQLIVHDKMTLAAGLELSCTRCDKMQLLHNLGQNIRDKAYSDPALLLERPRLGKLLDMVDAELAKLATRV